MGFNSAFKGLTVKVKVKVTLEQDTKAQRGSRGCNRTLWSLWGGWNLYVGVRVLPRQGSHVEGSFGHWGVEKSLKRTTTRPLRWPWERMQWHRVARAVELLFLKPPGVPVETRWCNGAVHQTYLVINYTIIEVTLFCSDCSNYRYKSLYSYSCTCTT
jgi:hypothetical protein